MSEPIKFVPPKARKSEENPTVGPDALEFAENCTDLANAERFARQHGQVVRFDFDRERWLCWTGKHWEADATSKVMLLAAQTARAILLEAHDAADPKTSERLRTWASKSEKAGALRAMLDLSRPMLPVRTAELDTDPWALNVSNGTLDLRTGKLRQHRREDFITNIVNIEFNPTAACPRWEMFLLEVFARDLDLISYVQRAVGYTLTGSTIEQALLLLYGIGSNGKSTFIEIVARLLGRMHRATPFDALLVKDRTGASGHNEDLARLADARMVSAVEADAGRRLSEAVIKQLTGGDTVSASMKYGHAFDFVPRFKLWLCCNHKPMILGTDEGIWRRPKLIPFTQRFEGDRCDRDLPAKLAAELPGILAWAVEGARLWAEQGLGTAAAVTAATTGYRAEMDVLGLFIEELCIVTPEARVTAGDLYTNYKAWAERNGHEHLSQRGLAMRLRDRPEGFESIRLTGGTRAWRGVGLVTERSDA